MTIADLYAASMAVPDYISKLINKERKNGQQDRQSQSVIQASK